MLALGVSYQSRVGLVWSSLVLIIVAVNSIIVFALINNSGSEITAFCSLRMLLNFSLLFLLLFKQIYKNEYLKRY